MNPALPALALGACAVLAVVAGTMLRPPALRLSPPDSRAGRSEDAGDAKPRAAGPLRRLQQRLAPAVLALLTERKLALVRHRIAAAGLFRTLTLEDYAGRRAAFSALFALLALQAYFVRDNLPLAILALFLGWNFTDVRLSAAARRRQETIDRDMPDFLDVLAVTLAAGTAFRPAMARVTAAQTGPLGEEMTTVLRQIELGAGFGTAFRGLRDRNDAVVLRSFTTAVLQAEELGVPLARVLEDLGADFRSEAAHLARRRAKSVNNRVGLITGVVLLPATLVLLLTAFFFSLDLDLSSFSGLRGG